MGAAYQPMTQGPVTHDKVERNHVLMNRVVTLENCRWERNRRLGPRSNTPSSAALTPAEFPFILLESGPRAHSSAG